MNTLLAQITELNAAGRWSGTLLMLTLDVCIVLVILAMLMCLLRVIRGPHLADRALAADTLAVELIGFVILLMIRLRTSMFIDSILVLSLLGFAGTVAMAQYILRRHEQGAAPATRGDADVAADTASAGEGS